MPPRERFVPYSIVECGMVSVRREGRAGVLVVRGSETLPCVFSFNFSACAVLRGGDSIL